MSVWQCSVCGTVWHISSLGCPTCRESGNGTGPSALARYFTDPEVAEPSTTVTLISGRDPGDEQAEEAL